MRLIRFAGAVGKVKRCADIGHSCFPIMPDQVRRAGKAA
jgi:hypothetical protein